MSKAEFMEWLQRNFPAWSSSTSTTKLQHLASLRRFAEMEFNLEYDRAYPRETQV